MKNHEMMWATLIHLGYNMWGDEYHRYIPNNLNHLSTSVMRVDREEWEDYTNYMASLGLNTLIIDVGEGMRYESHPELAIDGSWTREEMEKELARLRSIGFTEIIPKLNFGAGHDIWLGKYDHMLSSKIYYQVTSDLIHEACEVFDANYVHLGMDEESYRFQNENRRGLAIVRQKKAWWRDLYHLVDCVEREGARAWVWSDYIWHHPEDFLLNMPKSVLQSNWYYGKEFENVLDTEGPDGKHHTMVNAFLLLEEHGYDQVPTGSNCYGATENMIDMTKFCTKNVAPERLYGFMHAPWGSVRKQNHKLHFDAADQLADSMNWFNKNIK